MKRPLGGHALESALFRALRSTYGCAVSRSEWLDKQQKVDLEIRSVNRDPLSLPVQVQITMRVAHYTKLRKYLKKRAGIKNAISLYVEVESEAIPNVDEIASAIARAAVEVQSRRLENSASLHGLRIGPEIAYFDLFVRLGELKSERESPERQQQLLRGVAQDFHGDRFTVFGEDGTFHGAHYIDVDDGTFRRTLRGSIGQDEKTYLVWYLPFGEFARDIRPRPEIPVRPPT